MIKFMATTKERRARETSQNITIGEDNIEAIDEFVYLGAFISPKSDVTVLDQNMYVNRACQEVIR